MLATGGWRSLFRSGGGVTAGPQRRASRRQPGGSVRAAGRVSPTCGGWGKRIAGAGAGAVRGGNTPWPGPVAGGGHAGAMVCAVLPAVAVEPPLLDHAGSSVTAGAGRLTLPKTNGRIAPITSAESHAKNQLDR